MTDATRSAVRKACLKAHPEIDFCIYPDCQCGPSVGVLTALIAAAKAEEREECAKLMEQVPPDDDLHPSMIRRVREIGRKQRAAAIRDRADVELEATPDDLRPVLQRLMNTIASGEANEAACYHEAAKLQARIDAAIRTRAPGGGV